ncbi:cytochrome C [Exilibacterium tricleocarpae]|uniref:Cytochrome C n=1 Tax=Exilibacterium tricleocarpae TaxID=2591008 RepID=A0A545T8L0_9GAMM|nr:cytochrome C [Exilibacterium tricleocarpae]
MTTITAQGQGSTAELPQGNGRELVGSLCTACHQVNQITRSSGYSSEGWQALIDTMIDLSASPNEQARIVKYLATHYPPNTKRAPTLVAGEVSVEFDEWQVPTLGQRSRDPIEAADGAIWWAGQWGNLIGSIDPKSSAMKEYTLPKNAMPHTVTTDTAGNIWYTGNKNGTLGKLDPTTGKITEYKMPDPAARDPHSAIFDKLGTLWFTLQHSNMIGRLNPATGDIKLVELKVSGSRPYGIKIDAQGFPWVACNGRNCLVKVDPQTMELTEIKLPNDKTTVRRLDIGQDGMIWYVNSSQGRLGRYDPKTGAIKEWPSPSGPRSHPYATVIIDGIIWYNESGMRPDTLVRFDPATERFQSWPIPSGKVYAGIIRHMRPTRDGKLLIHQSSTNRITLVTPTSKQTATMQ